ncbi:MAG: queuine tRNA-ribosyltransferase [Parcubacteria group bacterium Gr01-1014_19]|nr:MAG: queuine tRNA-ribosyltransferase [Parcubacteria group bacterium Gr01-1014_19]
MEFEILKRSKKTRARLGLIKTKHGVIHTPAFVPVATQAAIKGLTTDQLKTIGFESLLSNTYHLYLRPGDGLVKKMGGLHKFMNWDRPIWTDSGGFQVFSLGAAIEHGGVSKIIKNSKKAEGEAEHATRERFTKISEEGVEFKSHLDGSQHFLTPEKSIKIQENLGADMIFAFDECTSPMHDKEYTKNSMERTHRWARRCLKAFKGKKTGLPAARQALFGIVQGGAYKDLRIASAKAIAKMGFDGFGIGGSFGKLEMKKVLNWTIPNLPDNKPRHLLGIGAEKDILQAVEQGIDTFDCVEPTRLGRNGAALLPGGKRLNLRGAVCREDKAPINKNCGCYVCRNYSRAYLNHLFRANEMLGPILLTTHNLFFMEDLLRSVREKIAKEA